MGERLGKQEPTEPGGNLRVHVTNRTRTSTEYQAQSQNAKHKQLTLLRTLVMWSLASSEIVRAIVTNSYKQSRHEDDLNQPLSVQQWGSDGDKRRYFLIEGLDDTHFRVYRESNPAALKRTWINVAGTIDELRDLAYKLLDDGGQKARVLSGKMLQAIPRFEATEEVSARFQSCTFTSLTYNLEA